MSLKVFDLECQHGHVFEGWFSSRDDYETQQTRGLLSCPVCGDATVTKRLSAPRLNVSHLHEPARSTAPAKAGAQAAPAPDRASIQAAVMQQVRAMVKKAENVGPRFAEEARRMHEGETAERAIRGTATPEERAELADEGIAVMEVPDFIDESRLQ
jgi:hypothetical protein